MPFMTLIPEHVYYSPSKLFPYRCHHGAGMSEVGVILLSQRYHFFLSMLEGRDQMSHSISLRDMRFITTGF